MHATLFRLLFITTFIKHVLCFFHFTIRCYFKYGIVWLQCDQMWTSYWGMITFQGSVSVSALPDQLFTITSTTTNMISVWAGLLIFFHYKSNSAFLQYFCLMHIFSSLHLLEIRKCVVWVGRLNIFLPTRWRPWHWMMLDHSTMETFCSTFIKIIV